MNKKPTTLVWLKKLDNSYAVTDKGYDPANDLVLLWLYFDECVRFNRTELPHIKQDIEERGRTGCNEVGADLIDGKLQFQHNLIDGLHEIRISPENLLELIERWYELVATQVDKIVITNDNGKFSIGTE